MMAKRRGISYQKRVKDINGIYDRYAKLGVPNREIWRRYVYPVYGISERTFYNVLKAPLTPRFLSLIESYPTLFDGEEK
jgi:hypothetical protein